MFRTLWHKLADRIRNQNRRSRRERFQFEMQRHLRHEHLEPRRMLAVTAELLATALASNRLDRAPDIEWAETTAGKVWQLAAMAPIGHLDRQALLAEPDHAGRISRLAQLLDEVLGDLKLLGNLE